MHSVFIVDDEIIVREGIREKIAWDETPFSLAGEAGDGEIALSMIQDIKPDILITDIKMPFMDGLELSRLVKKIQPWIKIIILSGHDEFEYAKKAISIGVEEYILKPFSSEDLLASLTKVAHKIDMEKAQLDDIKYLKKQLESNITADREKFLTRLVLGNISAEEVMQYSSDLRLDITGRYYSVCICGIRTTAENFSELYKMKSRLMDLASSFDNVIGFSFSLEKFIFILRSTVVNTIEEDLYSLAEAVLHQTSDNPTCTVAIAFGSMVDRISGIKLSYSVAEKLLESRVMILKKNCILNSEDSEIRDTDAEKDPQHTISLSGSDPIVDRLRYAAVSDIDSIIAEFISLLGENEEQFDIMASYLVVDIIMAISTIISENGSSIKEQMPEIVKREFVTKAVSSKGVFIHEMHRIIENVIRFRDSKIHSRYSDAILRAKKYIGDNYANPDICLHSVAEEIAFSPNHFSAVFSQECGMTFIEYLTKIRVNQAKKLLRTTKMLSSDICYKTGFNDPHYFSFIFKKTTGISPREYRISTDQTEEDHD